MVSNPVWEICEHVAEVQALLDDHLAGGKHSAADVVAKAQAVLSEAELLRAMFVVGYFPPNTPPGTRFLSLIEPIYSPWFCCVSVVLSAS